MTDVRDLARERGRPSSGTRVVQLLDVDPDLAAGLADSGREQARAALGARVYRAARGDWDVRQPRADAGAFGLLVIDGILGLRTTLADRTTLELVGHGDLLRPWVRLDAEASMTPHADWEVLAPARIALLDRRFAEAAAPWPEITAALMHRLVLRARRLCYQLAANASPRADQRLLCMLWAIADRWGRVTEEGTVIEIPLTHQQLAELVCTKRPSVSTALAALRERRAISYTRDRFVLHGEVPHEVTALKSQVALP
jgi:hypothetical protein